jgi:hypothetical protein
VAGLTRPKTTSENTRLEASGAEGGFRRGQGAETDGFSEEGGGSSFGFCRARV